MRVRVYTFYSPDAEVVELVDALVSGISGRNPVGVRVPPSAFLIINCQLLMINY